MAKSNHIEKTLSGNRRVKVRGELVMVTNILRNSRLQERLISENPESAIQLYEFNETPSLGRLLVKDYKKRGKYDPRIALIAKEHTLPYLHEPLNPIKQAALDAEEDIALAGVYRKRTGDKVSR